MAAGLKAVYSAFAAKAAAAGKTELVFGYGDPASRILLLGEAPGREEVASGRPFTGRAGKNLDAFLTYTGLARHALFITNVVKFRPFVESPGGRTRNRPPNQEEIAFCSDCLAAELEAVSPDLVVTLGNTPLRAMAGMGASIGALHGAPVRAGKWQLFPLYHPASVLYNPRLQEVYMADLQQLKAYLGR